VEGAPPAAGVVNDILVWIGLRGQQRALVMINNQTGTIIAMTHILLPFMILPLYSVMKGIPPSYVRAAKSLGANDWTAFWRVYFPQSVPGIGAGSILVFILAIGYYITPELVGGTKGVFISNRIAYHISDSLNWGSRRRWGRSCSSRCSRSTGPMTGSWVSTTSSSGAEPWRFPPTPPPRNASGTTASASFAG
jgi:hypothetical protein